MGPGRGGDGGADLPVEAAAERVDLGERSRPQERPADAQHDVAAASSRAGGHWLAGLVRADVLGVTGVAVVVLSVIGVPFLSAIQQMTFFRTPVELSSAWAFLPSRPEVSRCCSALAVCGRPAGTAPRGGCGRWRVSRCYSALSWRPVAP